MVGYDQSTFSLMHESKRWNPLIISSTIYNIKPQNPINNQFTKLKTPLRTQGLKEKNSVQKKYDQVPGN